MALDLEFIILWSASSSEADKAPQVGLLRFTLSWSRDFDRLKEEY